MTDRKWALILGASGGIGSGIALALARSGYDLLCIHLDTTEKQDDIVELQGLIEQVGGKSRFFNINAANESAMNDTIAEIEACVTHSSGVHVLVHALAFGSLLPFIQSEDSLPAINKRQMDMTLSIMAHSLVYWAQALQHNNLFSKGAKIFALTSIGGSNVLQNYGAVSAAKSALESHVRQLACELAPFDIAVNAIRAGVTPTPALMKIPNADALLLRAKQQNPFHRLTTPEDIGEIISTLSALTSSWVTGNVIGADGGEKLTL